MTAPDAAPRALPAPLEDEERCAVCGETARHAFCHLYGERETISLCSPACAEIYVHRPTGNAADDYFSALATRDVA